MQSIFEEFKVPLVGFFSKTSERRKVRCLSVGCTVKAHKGVIGEEREA